MFELFIRTVGWNNNDDKFIAYFLTDADKKCDSPMPVVKRTVFQHNTIINRNVMQ